MLQVKIDPEKRSFESGTNIRLECRVEGYPPPRVVWYKNNARIPRSNRIVVENEKTLVINRASPIGTVPMSFQSVYVKFPHSYA
jgi:hypothetical protein